MAKWVLLQKLVLPRTKPSTNAINELREKAPLNTAASIFSAPCQLLHYFCRSLHLLTGVTHVPNCFYGFRSVEITNAGIHLRASNTVGAYS